MKNHPALILLPLASFVLASCASLADNPILIASAYHPSNWVARAILVASIKKKQEEEMLRKPNLEYAKPKILKPKIKATDLINLAKEAEKRNDANTAIKCWYIAGALNFNYGFYNAAKLFEEKKDIIRAAASYAIAGENGIEYARQKAQEMRQKLTVKDAEEIDKELSKRKKAVSEMRALLENNNIGIDALKKGLSINY